MKAKRKHPITKRILSVSLMAALVCGLLAFTPLQAQAATKYNLWVGGKQVTSANKNDVLSDGGSVKYNPSKHTLTLKNATIKSPHVFKGNSGKSTNAVIMSFVKGKNFTIVLSGNNKISVPSNKNIDYSFGIVDMNPQCGNTTIKGNGSLSIRAGGTRDISSGIGLWNNLTIRGSVKIDSRGNSNTADSTGMYAKKIIITDKASVTAWGKNGAIDPAPTFKNYIPKVSAGSSAKNLKIKNKTKPSAKTYTKYQYVTIKKGSASSSGTSTLKKPGKATIQKVQAGTGSYKIWWNRITKNCNGYELQTSENKKFPTNATFTYEIRGQTDGTSIVGLTKGHKYYIRLRGFNRKSDKNIAYGAWSTTKSIVAK